MTMHGHGSIVQAHPHPHAVHYQRHGTTCEHLTTTHGHEHAHPPLSTTTRPIRIRRRSTSGGHVHDHPSDRLDFLG